MTEVRSFVDADEFLVVVEPSLLADPVRHTVLLTALHGYRSGAYRDSPPLWLAAFDGPQLVGLALRTPPWPVAPMILPAAADREAVADQLGRAIAAAGPELTGRAFTGPSTDVTPIVQAWSGATGLLTTPVVELLLHRLGTFVPAPGTAGTARPAASEDITLLAHWRHDFSGAITSSTASGGPDPAPVRRSQQAGAIWMIWRDAAGQPVSMAVAGPEVAGCRRVGPVYTPPGHERRGYGTAVTSAVVQAVRSAGTRTVVLFTDLANPTSNAIYHRLGFRPVERFVELGPA